MAVMQSRDAHGRFSPACPECAKRDQYAAYAARVEGDRHILSATKLDYERRLRNLRGWLVFILIAGCAAVMISADLHFGWI